MGCNNCNSGTSGGCDRCDRASAFDWLSGISDGSDYSIVELKFKNSRTDFFIKPNEISLAQGDIVSVESKTGYDIGIVALTGEIVKNQLKRKATKERYVEKKIYRLSSQKEIDLWQKTIKTEKETTIKARELAKSLNLNMKISYVETQADAKRTTFYYTAEGRVDFRELIKKFIQTFRVRIEMKQIGYRQETAGVGGIGSCGRELCCSSWLRDFRTVSTSAARYQQLSINPDKITGQCGKLKCCLNFELDNYTEALKEFPKTNIKLKTKKGIAVFRKLDVFKKLLWYSVIDKDKSNSAFVKISVDSANKIILENKKGVIIDDLNDYSEDKNIDIDENKFKVSEKKQFTKKPKQNHQRRRPKQNRQRRKPQKNESK